MAERDAFGRLPDENSLAGLGALSEGIEVPTTEPVATASSSDPVFSARPSGSKERPTHAKPDSPSQRVSSSPAADQSLADAIRQVQQMSGTNVTPNFKVVGRVVKLAVFLVVIAIIASVGGSIFSASKDVRDSLGSIPSPSDVADDIKEATDSGSSSTPDKESPPPTGLSSNSMLTRRNFRRAMTRLRTSGLGRMRTMSVRPERIDAQLLTKGGSLRSVQIKYDDPEINDFGAGGGGFSHLETIPFARIDNGAPARLARSAAGRAEKPVSQVDYVVLLSFAGKPMWSGFMKNGRQYLANSHGRITRSIN